ncbi:phytoene/squalene synthase family protein [bacterium]|nr:MAG: phytoene/squalene synthase family protein [bacterium]
MELTKDFTFRPFYERTSLHTSVITEVGDENLQEAYTFCRNITREHAKTFYLATRFLPNKKQRAIFAVYALCRFIDDTVDEAIDLQVNRKLDLNEIQQRLDVIREQVKVTFDTGYATNKIFRAIAHALQTYQIKKEHVLLLIDGVYMDLYKNRYKNFDELYDYSYKVASVVGLMTSEIFGYSSPEALKYAVDLGIAMQLTNIIRDVGEDLERNRIYLPQDEMDAFGVTETDLRVGIVTPEIRQLLKFQVDRAREYYKSAEKGIAMLDRDSRLPVWLARYNYARILDKVEQCEYKVLKKRVFLSTKEKLAILPSSIVRSYLL